MLGKGRNQLVYFVRFKEIKQQKNQQQALRLNTIRCIICWFLIESLCQIDEKVNTFYKNHH